MEFVIKTSQKFELVNITNQVQEAVAKTRVQVSASASPPFSRSRSKIKEGIAVIFVPHTSAAVMAEEDEPGLKQDFYELFREYEKRSFRHPDGNAEAHILAGIIGHSRVVPIRNGKLDLGTWQSILLVELDGPRQRRITVSVLPS